MMFDLLVLNEASLPFPCVASCGEGLSKFFAIVQRARVRKLRFFHCEGESEHNWKEFHYADGFEFGRWLNELDADLRRTIKEVLANVNCFPVASLAAPSHFSPDNFLHVLASDTDVEAIGLGAASLFEGRTVSFESGQQWRQDRIAIIRQWDEAGAVQSVELYVPNIYSMSGLESALVEIVAKAQAQRAYFGALSEDNNEDFPNLIFCRSAIKDVQNASNSPLDFKNLVDVFNRLNEAIVCSNNLLELISKSELDISGESDATMNSRKLLLRRQFNHPDLGPSIFEHHVKNFGGGKRLHFIADFNEKKLCIGYFGKHLPV